MLVRESEAKRSELPNNDKSEIPTRQQEPGAVSLSYDALQSVNFACAQNDMAGGWIPNSARSAASAESQP